MPDSRFNVEQLFRELSDIKEAVRDVERTATDGFKTMNGRLQKCENQILVLKTTSTMLGLVLMKMNWTFLASLFGSK